MGWESRPGGRYYYQKERLGARVVSRYVGAGELAEMIAKVDDAGRARRRWEAVQRGMDGKERERQRALDRQVDQVIGQIRLLTSATLVLAGCHNHRGQWRRRRE